jgi:hypothetical protein
MNCANHTEREATAFCQNCGKPLCPECTRTAEGLRLCEPCLLERQVARQVAHQVAQQAGQTVAANPGWAYPGTGFPGGPGASGAYAAAPSSGATNAGWQAVPGAVPPVGAAGMPPAGTPPYLPGFYPPGRPGSHNSSVIAGLLGFIPGVGAMYNGQFVKALLHVVVFIVLIGASEHFSLSGILIPAWIFYQVFDAAQTAAARRDGRPLPDPFGILDLSQRLGPQSAPSAPGAAYNAGYGAAYGQPRAYAPSQNPPQSPVAAVPAGSTAYTQPAGTVVPPSGQPGTPNPASYPPQNPTQYSPQYPPQYSPQYPPPYPPPYIPSASAQGPYPGFQPVYPTPSGPGAAGAATPGAPYTAPYPVAVANPRSEPVGAIVLIVVGLLFLLSTLGWLSFDWIAKGWPVLLLLLGGWLLLRRARANSISPPPGSGFASEPAGYAPGPAGPGAPSAAGNKPPPEPRPGTGLQRNPLTITPEPSGPAEPSGRWAETTPEAPTDPKEDQR